MPEIPRRNSAAVCPARSAGCDRTVITGRSNYVNCTTRTGLSSREEEDPKRVYTVSVYIHGILRLADANEGR